MEVLQKECFIKCVPVLKPHKTVKEIITFKIKYLPNFNKQNTKNVNSKDLLNYTII